jgi:hypothetical protein
MRDSLTPGDARQWSGSASLGPTLPRGTWRTAIADHLDTVLADDDDQADEEGDDEGDGTAGAGRSPVNASLMASGDAQRTWRSTLIRSTGASHSLAL